MKQPIKNVTAIGLIEFSLNILLLSYISITRTALTLLKHALYPN